MATVKAFSVARTASTKTDTATAASTVYSLGSGSPGFNGDEGATPSAGRNLAYDHNSPQGLVEGRTPTLVLSGQTVTGAAAATPFSSETTAGTASSLESTSVVADTTTITGDGAGLIVQFTTTAAGAIPAVANVTAVRTGMGYADGDTVSVDGWPDSVYVVDAA